MKMGEKTEQQQQNYHGRSATIPTDNDTLWVSPVLSEEVLTPSPDH